MNSIFFWNLQSGKEGGLTKRKYFVVQGCLGLGDVKTHRKLGDEGFSNRPNEAKIENKVVPHRRAVILC